MKNKIILQKNNGFSVFKTVNENFDIKISFEEDIPKNLIKLDIPLDHRCLFDGVDLWREYEFLNKKEGVIFGVIHSIGDRMNSWAKMNHYIAIDEKKNKIIGAIIREMGWHGSFGEKVNDWKKRIINEIKKIEKNKNDMNWSEDPKTEMHCQKCGTIWKLGESIGCPKCEGSDGGLNENNNL